MGWTSIEYKMAEHLTLTGMQAFKLISDEHWDYIIPMFHFVQAKDEDYHNELYTVMTTPNGKNFICVHIIDIKNGEIYWKSIEESMCPAYTNCPVVFFEHALAEGELAIKWREQCQEVNVNFVMKQL